MKIVTDEGLVHSIRDGVNTLGNVVGSTLGPKGRTVIVKTKEGKPFITKDGATIAKNLTLEDESQNLIVEIVKQASENTAIKAGDGTTTTTILVQEIVERAMKYIVSGVDPVFIKRGLEVACKEVVKKISELATPVSSTEDVSKVAVISANNDKEIGSLVAKAVIQAGRDGAISIEKGNALETKLEVVEGFCIDSGYAASAFVNDQRRNACRLDNAWVLVTDEKIDSVSQMLPVLELIARDGNPLVIVADSVDGQALASLIMNTVRGSMKILAVKAPRYGQERREILKDLSISVGATFICKENNIQLDQVELKHLGRVKSIDCEKSSTIFTGGNGDEDRIDERIDSINAEIKQTENLNECEVLQERVTRLSSGVSIIKVGGATEVEAIERKHRIEDALEAVRSAQSEGLVCGGGATLLYLQNELHGLCSDDETLRDGASILLRSLSYPFEKMASNSGMSPDVCKEKLLDKEYGVGYNFLNGEVADLFGAGIVDPAKVTRCALENAVSVASVLITSGFALYDN